MMKDLKLEGVGLFDELYVGMLKERRIYLNQDIDDEIVDKVTMPILFWNEEDKHTPVEDRKPITIYMNSNGGSVIVGMHLVETIKNSKTPVHCVVLSKAYSCGLLITIACHKRFATKSSTFLLHDGSFTLADSSAKARDTMKFFKVVDEEVKAFILEKTKITAEQYEKLERTEFWCYGEKALELGFIDELLY